MCCLANTIKVSKKDTTLATITLEIKVKKTNFAYMYSSPHLYMASQTPLHL